MWCTTSLREEELTAKCNTVCVSCCLKSHTFEFECLFNVLIFFLCFSFFTWHTCFYFITTTLKISEKWLCQIWINTSLDEKLLIHIVRTLTQYLDTHIRIEKHKDKKYEVVILICIHIQYQRSSHISFIILLPSYNCFSQNYANR